MWNCIVTKAKRQHCVASTDAHWMKIEQAPVWQLWTWVSLTEVRRVQTYASFSIFVMTHSSCIQQSSYIYRVAGVNNPRADVFFPALPQQKPLSKSETAISDFQLLQNDFKTFFLFSDPLSEAQTACWKGKQQGEQSTKRVISEH